MLLPAPVPTKAVRRLAASVLIAEAFVVFFAVLVAVRLSPDRTRVVLITGIVLAATAIALSGLLRHRWAYLAGWLLQVALVATGAAVPVMFALGLIFAVLWAAAIRVGSRLADR
ncbi:MAG: DUF4233 domain-containing protein [Actinomycetes bacterium]